MTPHKNMLDRNYYVYVYIDPRNYEEFYYGKGKGSRRYSHLSDGGDSEKAFRIRAINAEGLEPIIRTVAAGLTENEAYLVETTLLWKLGKGLLNRAPGRYVSLFRPQNSLHREIPSFDFKNGIYYVNVGEGSHRNWDDCRKFGFLSAGQGAHWKDQLLDLDEGDIVVPYLKRKGYVGVGRVKARAVPYLDFRHAGRLLQDCGIVAPHMTENCHDPAKSEYVTQVEWLASVSRSDAKWKAKGGLFTTQLVRASLERQPSTLQFIETEFSVNLRELIL
jgi:hypothetical protein